MKLRALFILSLLFCFGTSQAQTLIGDSLAKQSAIKILRMAHQSMKYEDWYSAIELFEICEKKRPRKLHPKYDLGLLYYKIREYRIAEKYLKEVTTKDTAAYPEAWFFRGQCLKSLGEYGEAAHCFEEFGEHYRGLKDRRKYRRLIKAEEAILPKIDSIANHPLPAEVRHEKDLSLKTSESGLAFFDENTLFYSAVERDELPIVNVRDSVPDIPLNKIYQANLVNGEWIKKGLVEGEINELDGHIVNPIITYDKRYMIFSVCKEDWKGENNCDLYQARRVNDSWKRVEKMKFGINASGYTSTQPAIGRDPEKNRYILYFVSNRPGGKGGLDVWYTRYNKRDDEWDKPRNCGSKINTVGDEETPWFDIQEGTMYFSSNGHPGIGGMDVYKVLGERSRWTEPELLGIPINSAADDVYFRKQPRDRYMMLTSNRKGSESLWKSTCCDDIYELFFPQSFHSILKLTAFEIPDPDGELNGRAKLPDTQFKVFYIDPLTKEKFYVKSDTAHDGEIYMQIEPGRIYSVEGVHPGYFADIHQIDMRSLLINDTMSLDMEMRKWDDQPIVVPNIYFEFDSDQLTADSKSSLDSSIYNILIENPEIIIEILAHTDNKGTSTYNRKLSQSRAESVVNYLAEKGIEKDRLKAKGYGEDKPIAPNENPDGSDNPEGRAKNRRVEFRVIGTKLQIQSMD